MLFETLNKNTTLLWRGFPGGQLCQQPGHVLLGQLRKAACGDLSFHFFDLLLNYAVL